jgi:tetratricopeptide (TPR) repeat protein
MQEMNQTRKLVRRADGSLRQIGRRSPAYFEWLGAGIAASLFFLAAAPAWAIDDATKTSALRHYRLAKSAYEAKQYSAASSEFQLAQAELPLPVVALWMGRAFARSGDLESAVRAYSDAIGLKSNELWFGDKQQRAQQEAEQELEKLRRLASTLKSSASGSTRTAREPGREQAGPDTGPWRTIGWVSLTAGAGALAFGSVTGLMLASRHNEMKSECRGGICNPSVISSDQVDEYNGLRTASTIGLMSGALLGAVGVVLVLAPPTRDAKPELALQVTSTGAILQGAF